jgi:hypothetical protein
VRRVAHAAAVLAVAISAPVLAGAMIDYSVVSVLGQPCSGSCQVGGANLSNPGQAQGGHEALSSKSPSSTNVASGTSAVVGGRSTGHVTETTPAGSGTASGNFNTIPSAKGHCTGILTGSCS